MQVSSLGTSSANVCKFCHGQARWASVRVPVANKRSFLTGVRPQAAPAHAALIPYPILSGIQRVVDTQRFLSLAARAISQSWQPAAFRYRFPPHRRRHPIGVPAPTVIHRKKSNESTKPEMHRIHCRVVMVGVRTGAELLAYEMIVLRLLQLEEGWK